MVVFLILSRYGIPCRGANRVACRKLWQIPLRYIFVQAYSIRYEISVSRYSNQKLLDRVYFCGSLRRQFHVAARIWRPLRPDDQCRFVGVFYLKSIGS